MNKNRSLGLLATLIVTALALTAVTAGGSLASKGSITVDDGVFAGTTTAIVNPGGDNAWAHAECFQGGTLVYAQTVEVDSNNQATLTLGPTPSWQSGDADCTASEDHWNGRRFQTVARTTFHVDDPVN